MVKGFLNLGEACAQGPPQLRVFYVVSDCQSVVTRSVTSTSPNCLRMDEYGPPEIPNYRTILFMSDDLVEFNILFQTVPSPPSGANPSSYDRHTTGNVIHDWIESRRFAIALRLTQSLGSSPTCCTITFHLCRPLASARSCLGVRRVGSPPILTTTVGNVAAFVTVLTPTRVSDFVPASTDEYRSRPCYVCSVPRDAPNAFKITAGNASVASLRIPL